MGDNLVPDYFSKINQNDFFGWPYYYLGNNIQPKIKIPENFKKILVNIPDVLFKSHSGPIDFIFYNKKQFPKTIKQTHWLVVVSSVIRTAS